MKLYLISQDVNNDWDTYDSAVVAAETEEQARVMHPGGGTINPNSQFSSWATNPDDVLVEYIGDAASGTKSGIICASFTAG